ncbi:MAG: ankyrin repeat domain-containing protein [Candidatus Avelusimicrobium sp.]|uniref:ankyrin repeat domain-containing protein n=1 Tax=Candidatus Avelusimicrobium sp. TaxID=3048833 RepID=UPI003F021083
MRVNRQKSLFTAIEKGNLKTVKELLKSGWDANSSDSDNETALYKACATPHLSIVKTLIHAGADVNLADRRGVTPLMMACLYGYKNIIKELLRNGADVKRISDFGGALSHSVGTHAQPEIVKLLLKHGADVNERALIYENETPLFCACRCGQLKIVEILLEAKADVNAVNDLDNTPLQEMLDNNQEDTPQNLKRVYSDIIAVLTALGAKTTEKTDR